MADLVYMHKDKWTDHLDAIRAKAGTSDTMTVDEATTAVEGISGGTDTSDATLNSGGQMLSGVTAYSQGTKYTGTIPTQAAATITPTESAQTAVSAGKYTAGDVTVGSIPSDYIGTDIPRRSSISVSQDNNTIHVDDGYYENDIDASMGACTVTGATVLIDNQGDATGSIIVGRGGYINSGSHTFYVDDAVTPRSSSDLTASGATVSVPYGYYPADASKTVASGSAGTPTATKGSVSNHAVNVTPSVTNTTGYITGGTKTGTAVSVSASELVSGNKAITENGTGIDVANYSTVSVDVQSGSTVSVVDTTDSGGGTVRTITASGTTIPTPASDISKLILNGVTQMDVTDTTATVSDVASGKVFTQVDGTTGTGTASGGGYDLIDILNRTVPSGDVVLDSDSNFNIRSYFFQGYTGITSFSSNRARVIDGYAFQNCTNMTTFSVPNVSKFWGSALEGCSSLTSIETSTNYDVTQNCFRGLSSLQSFDFYGNGTANYMMYGCSALAFIDMKNPSVYNIAAQCFANCSSLKTIVIRKTSSIVLLADRSAFSGTPGASGGTGIDVYVPSALKSTYENATNWATLVSGGTITFKTIEGSIYA